MTTLSILKLQKTLPIARRQLLGPYIWTQVVI